MKKSELVETVASGLEVPHRNATLIVDEVLQAISDGVAADGVVSLPGFGSFTAKDVPARQVRNPATGETMPKPATRRVSFKAGNQLKAKVASGTPSSVAA